MAALFTILATSFVIALSGAAMPGPLMTVTISESIRRGFISGPLIVLGHSVLELALVILLMFGLAPFLKQDWVFAVIAITGAVMLTWMGVGMIRSVPSLTMHMDTRTRESSHVILSGMLISISSPYWIVWWATIGLGYVLYCARFGTLGIVFFFIGHCLGDLAWYGAISYTVGKGRQFLNDSHYRALIGTCAVFLLLLACWFAWSGVNKALSL
jgi:threonine/homoserine/homoserine lactone efflux protein